MQNVKGPDAKGVIRVPGHEDEVLKFKTSHQFWKKLNDEIDEWKVKWRGFAKAVLLHKSARGVKRIEFMSGTEAIVPVTIPDWSKESNRNNLKEDTLSHINRMGLSPEAYISREEVITLKGQWVKWFKENYIKEGVEIPPGVEFSLSVKLSDKGYVELEKLAMDESATPEITEAARALLEAGLKAPSVASK